MRFCDRPSVFALLHHLRYRRVKNPFVLSLVDGFTSDLLLEFSMRRVVPILVGFLLFQGLFRHCTISAVLPYNNGGLPMVYLF